MTSKARLYCKSRDVHTSPEKRRCGIAMQEHYSGSILVIFANVHIGHIKVERANFATAVHTKVVMIDRGETAMGAGCWGKDYKVALQG